MTEFRGEHESRGLRPSDLGDDPASFFGALFAREWKFCPGQPLRLHDRVRATPGDRGSTIERLAP